MYSAKTKQLDDDMKIFATKSKTVCIIGLTKWDDFSKSWYLEIASHVRLERTDYDRYKVMEVLENLNIQLGRLN